MGKNIVMRFWPWTSKPQTMVIPESYEVYNAYSQLLDRNGKWIEVADTKAGVVLGFLVATFPVLIAPTLPFLQRLIKSIPPHATLWSYVSITGFFVLLILFLFAAGVTLVRVFLVLIPRLKRSGMPGLVFFGDIASQEHGQWQQRILNLDTQMFASQILEQVYATASIASYKHKHVVQAIRTLFMTIVLGMVLYIVSQIIL